MNNNSIIKKSNSLINAHYKLNINEQKILYKVISQIHIKDRDFKNYEFKISELANFIGTKSNAIYKDIKQWTYNLLKEVLVIERDDLTIQTNWFSAIQYVGNNKIIFSFHPVLKPYLLNLKESFTRFSIENVRKIRGKHSTRVYELLKQYEKLGYRVISVEELRNLLVLEGSYRSYNAFKQYVLYPVIDEINTYTDIFVKFKELKEGKKITEVAFYIKSKNIDKPNCIDLPIENKKGKKENLQLSLVDLSTSKLNVLKNVIKNVIDDEVKDKKIIEWIESNKENDIRFYLNNWSKWDYKDKATKAGFFIDLVDNNRTLPAGKKGIRTELNKPVQSTNYEQREYDDDYFDSLYDNFTLAQIKAMRKANEI